MENKQILVNEICPTSTQSWIRNGALMVDVREEDEVALLAYDVPQIVNIPLSEFESRFKELPTHKNLILACHSGSRSLPATGFLIMNGYDPSKVVSMKHGIMRWVEKGYPTNGDTSDIGTYAEGCDCGTASSEKGHTSCGHAHNSDGSHC